ncbi:2'-5' RNA ligase family protein [Flavobacterium sp. LS1R47]|jgi:2'-5' RNA ligase|uniref:2'-5' RNA ligase family protein n=1 Tax=Flavobacterium frigoritolerans TaxID=2987686 RepID=A0A9X3HM36_9FLAO|nr:2'-5' RNA ligase family protein [Flavobacterium frigoritolerans]MCV9933951.1 2'-5' RNA ligase family protein [Flavobacterium frigoritolerans]
MLKHYSVAIYPPEPIIAIIKAMKEQLAKEVGWFNSKNSVAHNTICEFKVSDKELELVKSKLNRLCDSFEPFEIQLDRFNSYTNGAFVITPNEVSKNKLKPIMKRVQQSLLITNMKKSDNPHLSIARRLSPENIKIANQIFTTVDINFVCDNIVLRQFDDTIKQFIVIDTFKFNSNPQPELIQGTLF